MSEVRTLIIIPAYNEQDSIEKTVADIEQNLPGFDYLIVNDGSTDRTGELLDERGYSHIDLPVNLGLSGAVQGGYKYAYQMGYDCAVQFDGDGQHQARYIMDMVKEIENGYDIVIGSRFVNKKKDHSLRMIGARILTVLIRLRTGTRVADPTSGMRLLNRKMIHDYAYNMNRQPEPDTLAYQLRRGAKIKEVQVEMNERTAGVSLYKGLWPAAKYMISMIISIIFLS
ncbi:MAG: glycosyltransferase family 2 protein [Solobacterium sp.]|nr:glycosyltransferase family 2 protein [Solobacterium sp.]